MAGSCLSLSGSTACPAWNTASVSTDSSQYNQLCVISEPKRTVEMLISPSPFLENVSNITQFDKALSDYVSGSYVSSQ